MLNMSSFLDMGMGCASETPAPFTAVAPASENEICGVSVVLLSLILLVGSHKLVFDQRRVLELSLYAPPLLHLHLHCFWLFIDNFLLFHLTRTGLYGRKEMQGAGLFSRLQPSHRIDPGTVLEVTMGTCTCTLVSRTMATSRSGESFNRFQQMPEKNPCQFQLLSTDRVAQQH